ncbi:hypothetical protein FQR65_LT11595 [Abscondita terminalis]|nr:hypothetical protein FQR65_LT11595 [Abscondita terminalis]
MYKDDTNRNEYECINRVIRHVFVKDETLLIIHSNNNNYVFPNTILNPRLLISIEKLRSFEYNIYFRMGIILYMDDTINATNSIYMISSRQLIESNLNANVKWIVVTPIPNIAEYFLTLWKIGIVNVVVLVNNFKKNDTYARLYTSDPQDILNNCEEDLNSVNEQTCDLDINIQFPKSLRKYTNCAIKYSNSYELRSGTQLGYLVINFVTDLITQYLNSSFAHDGKNFEYKYFLRSNYLRYVTNSIPSSVIFSPKVIWAVPKPKLIPLINVIKIIFKKTVWFLMAFSFLLVSIVWWLIAKYSCEYIENRYDFTLVLLNVWESTILGCANRVPVIWSLRFVFISYIVYSIHIQAIINSKIVEILTIPQYEPGIQNLEELSESNLRIILINKTKQFMFDYNRYEGNRNLNKINKLLLEIEFNKVAETFFDCVTKKICAAIFMGDEPFLNKTFFEISDVIEDNSLTGNIDYVLHIDYLNYMYLTLNKVVCVLVESGIIDQFIRVVNFAVLHKFNNNNTYARLYNSNPQNILNSCGKVLNSVSEQICDSDISIQFPKHRRKYTNCAIKYNNNYEYQSNTQLGNVVSNFVKNLITLHLNLSYDQEYSDYVRFGLIRYVTNSIPSSVIFSPKVMWAVPKPKLIPLINVIKIIFKKTVWILMVFSFLLVSIIWWLITKYVSKCIDDRCDFTVVLLNVWESTILGCANRVPVIWSLRFVFISYIVYSIHIQAIINSKIVEILTIPQYEPGISNLEELSESNLQIIITKLTKEYMFDINRNEVNTNLNKIYKLLRVVEFNKVAETFFDCVTKNLCAVIFMGYEPFLNKTFFEISNVIEDNSLTGNIDYVLYVDYFNYIYLTLNKIVYTLVESGIIDQFIRTKMIERNVDSLVTCRSRIIVALKMGFSLTLLCVCVLITSAVNCSLMYRDDTNRDEYQCINRVIGNVFVKEETLLIIHSTNSNYVFPNTISNSRLLISIEELRSFKSYIYFRMGIIIYMDTITNVRNSIHMITSKQLIESNLNANVKWIIVTPFPNIAEYFLTLWKVGVINAVVLLNNYKKNNTYAMLYTSDPQDIVNNCGEAFNSVNEQTCDLDVHIQFPKPLRKYTNCVLKYYKTYEYQSDALVSVVTNFLTDSITQHLNSTYEQTGTDFQNANFVRAQYLRYVTTSTTPSTVFFSPKIIWAVPKPKLIPLINVIKVIFKKTVWVVMALSFLLVSIVWWLIIKYVSKCIDDRCDFTLVLLNVWESTILGCANRVPVTWSLRFVFISYIVYSIHIQAIINSKIVEILTIPQYEPAIRNLEELSESNLQIIIIKDFKEYLFDDNRNESNRNLNKIYTLLHAIKFDEVAEIFFDCITKKLCAAIFMGEEPFLNKTFFEILDVIEDNSLTGNIDYVLHMDYYYYMYLTLNKIVYILVESGIIDQFVRKQILERDSTVSFKSEDPIPLSVENVYIIFIFWSAGLGIALFTLIAEFLIKYDKFYNVYKKLSPKRILVKSRLKSFQ